MGLRDILRKHIRRSVRFPGFRLREAGRSLTVRMDTTNICNLRCSMCPMILSDSDPDRKWHHMDPSLFGRIVREVFPLAGTVGLSCGAEPFCNPGFHEYLDLLYESDVPVREVVTNGTLLTDANIGYLLATPPTTLFVSIDGSEAGTHAAIRGGADLKTIMEKLAVLVRRRGRSHFPMVSFSTTLQRRNWKQLPGIIELAVSVGAASVGVVPMVPYSGLHCADETVDMDDPEVKESIGRAMELAEAAGLTLQVSAGPDPVPGKGCGYLDGWVYIDPDGKVNPCPHWNTSLPLGDLNTESFDEIINGPAYERLRKSLSTGMPEGNCTLCPEMTDSAAGEPEKV